MAEYTANAVQTVEVGQNVLFSDAPIPGCRQGILHREGSGIITLRGQVNNCSGFARYKISPLFAISVLPSSNMYLQLPSKM